MKRALIQSVKVTPYTSEDAINREGFLSAILAVKVGSPSGTPTGLAVKLTIIDRYLHEQAIGEPDRVVRVSHIRRHLHPMDRKRPQLHRDAQGRFLNDEVALALELEINLQEPPQGGVAHLMQRVRVGPEVQKRVLRKLLFVSVLIYPVELARRKG